MHWTHRPQKPNNKEGQGVTIEFFSEGEVKQILQAEGGM